jgi:hypothetical protein
MFARYNQEVYRGCRMNIAECYELLILIDNGGRYFPGYDFAEYTVIHSETFFLRGCSVQSKILSKSLRDFIK